MTIELVTIPTCKKSSESQKDAYQSGQQVLEKLRPISIHSHVLSADEKRQPALTGNATSFFAFEVFKSPFPLCLILVWEKKNGTVRSVEPACCIISRSVKHVMPVGLLGDIQYSGALNLRGHCREEKKEDEGFCPMGCPINKRVW